MVQHWFRVVAFAGLMVALALPTAAQGGSGAFLTSSGQLSYPTQVDVFAFDVDPETVTLGYDGDIDWVFVMSADAGSDLDPGLIKVEPGEGGGVVGGGAQRPDTAGSNASITLATLEPGEYVAALRGEHGTTGAYRLEVLLAGDANGDLKVDDADVALIEGLQGTKLGRPGYSPLADVDRNGVINGGDRQRALANLGAVGVLPEPVNPLDAFLPAGALRLESLSETGFNPRSGPLAFSLTGTEFDQASPEVKLTINGFQIGSNAITVDPDRLIASTSLVSGRNDIALKTYDTVGRPLYLQTTIWAGFYNLQVKLVHPNGSPFLGTATVTATLSDDHRVGSSATTTTGNAVFGNLPNRTILLQAKGEGNEVGTAGVLGSAGSATIVMRGFGAPSDVDNNDFSLGLAGWNTGGTPVAIVPHLANIPGFPVAPAGLVESLVEASAVVDNDLQVRTSGQGEKSVSRTFTSDPGVTGVRVRYRFVTSEVPGGYYGSQYNDYFRVSLRSQQAGGFESENNSMNGLGLAAFHYASGSTNWREIVLPLDVAGDTIQVDVAVANVADGLLDSQVIVDFVEELRNVVRPALAWNNTQGGVDLTYVVDEELTQDVPIEVYWASGAGYGNRLGGAIFTHDVASGTAAGTYGPIRIEGGNLAADPAGVTHLIAASSPTQVGALPDVTVAFGANADAAVVSAAMLDVVKDGLRAAGQSQTTITSTARTPADQARAMFQNLTNAANTIQQNITTQLGIYAAPGDAVINVFAGLVTGLTHAQIMAQAGPIRAAMEAEIHNQGPGNVSRHCGDPTAISVVDVTAAPFNNQNSTLFQNAVTPRVDRLIDERTTNNCFHLELAVTP